MKQQRDAKGRFLPKPKDVLPTRISTKVITLPENTTPVYMYEQRMFTEEDIFNAYIAGINDSGKGFLLPSKKAELYVSPLKRHT